MPGDVFIAAPLTNLVVKVNCTLVVMCCDKSTSDSHNQLRILHEHGSFEAAK
jgi:hypothetical protein